MGTREMLGAICARWIKVAAIVAILAAWTVGEARAQDWTQNQFTVGRFTVNFLGANQAYYNDGVNPPDMTGLAMTAPAEKQAIMRAFQFWAERLGQNTTVNNGGGGAVAVNVGWRDAGNFGNLASAGSVSVVGDVAGPGLGYKLAQPQAILTGMATPGTTAAKWVGADGFVVFNQLNAALYSPLRNSQVNPSAIATRFSFESTMIHELGHSLGIMGRIGYFANDPNTPVLMDDPLSLFHSKMQVDGTPVTADQLFPPGSIMGSGHNVTFAGANASSVYGDAWIPPATGQLPIENNVAVLLGDPEGVVEGGSDLVHPHTPNGVMNAVETFHERPFFSEAELAIMQDLGHTIQLRDFFGRSLYQSNHAGIINNTQGFGLWTGASYDTTQANMSTFGVGLHVVGASNRIIQDADMKLAGYAGAGIRIENTWNSVTLAQGRTISSTGDAGVGVILSEDQHTIFTHRGTIATAANGQGIAFDNSSAGEVNVTGTINGGTQANGGAAIYMGPNSQVLGGINFLRENGSTLAVTGDIVGQSTLSTTLRFGAAAAADGRVARDANGQIIANSGYNFAYAGIITGTCFDLDFLAGQTTLSGANNTIGRATVHEGALWLASGNFTGNNVSNSGTVTGTGSITTTGQFVNEQGGLILASGVISARGGLQNNGTIALANPIGIATFGGTFTNNPTGNLVLNISPPAGAAVPVAGVNNDQIRIVESTAGSGDGKAVLNGGSIHTTISGQPAQIGQVYSVLTTQNGLTVSTEPIVYDNVPLMGFYPRYNGMDFWLEVQRDLYGPYGRTYNQRQFGTYFDTLTANAAPGSELYNMLVMLDGVRGGASNYVSDAALHALDQASGSIYGSIASRGIQNTTIVNQTLAGVLRRNEFLPSAGDGTTASRGGPRPLWNIWSIGYDFGGDTLTDQNAFGYNENLGGTLVGMDCEAVEDLRVGAYFAYGDGRMSAKGLSEHSESKELTYGAYLRHRAGMGYLLLTGGAGYNDYSTGRYLSFADRLASSKHGADKATVYSEYGIDFSDEHSTFQPFVGLQYAGLLQDGIQESGAGGFDLSVNKASADSFRTMVGSRFGWNLFPTARGKVAANAQAMWMYDMINKPFTPVTARFSESDPGANYTVRGNSIGRNWAVLGTGLSWDIASVRLSAGYDAYLNGYQAIHSGNAAVTIGW